MTEDDETKLDVFTVAPDGKFSKFDAQHRAFLPYADLDALVINPEAVKPRPGSPEEEAIQAAEEQAKWAAEEERRNRGLDDVVPADAVRAPEAPALGVAARSGCGLQCSRASCVLMHVAIFPLRATERADGRALQKACQTDTWRSFAAVG